MSEQWRPTPRDLAKNALIDWFVSPYSMMAWKVVDWDAIDAINPDQHPKTIFDQVTEIMQAAGKRSGDAHSAAYAIWREQRNGELPDLDSEEFYQLWLKALL